MTLANAPTIQRQAWSVPSVFKSARHDPTEAQSLPLPLGLADRFALALVTPAEVLTELTAIPGFAEALDEALGEPADAGA